MVGVKFHSKISQNCFLTGQNVGKNHKKNESLRTVIKYMSAIQNAKKNLEEQMRSIDLNWDRTGTGSGMWKAFTIDKNAEAKAIAKKFLEF